MTTYVYKSTTGRPVNVDNYVITVNPGLQFDRQIEELDAAIGTGITRWDDGVQVASDDRTPVYGSIDPASSKIRIHSGSSSIIKSEIVDLRDWDGLDLTGNNDNSSILQAAIDQTSVAMNSQFGFNCAYRLQLPVGKIAFSTQLILKQSSYIEGIQAINEGTELRWVGADGVNAIANQLNVSYCTLRNLRIRDERVNPTSGRGISIDRITNGVILQRLQIMNFPSEQLYFGAPPGFSVDCVAMDDIWVTSAKTTAKGILIERADNNVSLHNIKSDIVTTPANDGYVIRVGSIANDNAVISISSVKHESNNRCPTISLPLNTRGNMIITSVQQRNPQGGAAGAGDVVQIGAVAGGSAFAVNGTTAGFTTGSTSETGGRLVLQNISGPYHGDWTGASGAATVRCLGSGTAVYGPVTIAQLGSGGRIVRDIAGAGIPQALIYGNVGDTWRSLDATSTKCAVWVKKSGAGTNTGWQPTTPETQSVAYAAAINADMNLGNRVSIGALTGAIALNGPTNIPVFGTDVIYELVQDGTGGRAVSYGSLHKGAWPTASGTAGQKQTLRGVSDGTNIVFTSASGWY